MTFHIATLMNIKSVTDDLEELLAAHIEELANQADYFHLPLTNIFSFISNVNLSLFSDKDQILNILHNFIQNTIKSHVDEKETLLLLQNIDMTKIQFQYKDIIIILSLFINCPVFNKLNCLYTEKNQLPDLDFEYAIQQKGKEIKKLKQKIKELKSSQEKPKDLESNIFKACKEGKLTSVQWLIEKNILIKTKKSKKMIIHHILTIVFGKMILQFTLHQQTAIFQLFNI